MDDMPPKTLLLDHENPGDWDFAQADTQELTHGIFYYPARMVPQIAARLLDTYCVAADVILDPFAGSGTTILEAILREHRALGIDVNPVAITLARAKCTLLETPINLKILLQHLESQGDAVDLSSDPIYLQAKRNIDYWYDPRVAEQILALRKGILGYLQEIGDPSHQGILLVGLMATIYACSKGVQDGSSFHTRKAPKGEQNPLTYFMKKMGENLEKVFDLEKRFPQGKICPKEVTIQDVLHQGSPSRFNITRGNALDILQTLPDASIGGIITSPPYGDEHSTVNYTRYTKHAAYWLGMSPEEVKRSSLQTLSRRKISALPGQISTTERTLKTIREINESDSQKVVHFLSEFYECLSQFQRILKNDAHCAIVIANRRVRQVEIPMDVVTSELAVKAGLTPERIFYRTFPKKVVAWKTISGSSMDQENILILRK